MSSTHSPFRRLVALHILQVGFVACGAPMRTEDIRESHSEEVHFASTDLTLRGRLALPTHASAERVPAAVFLSGSGPSSMDCQAPGQAGMKFLTPVPICRDLAKTLSDLGVAALTFDKRSCGPFNKCAENGYPLPPSSLTIDAFVDDAKAAIAFLRAHDEVDPERIFVVGHSEGAGFVPLLLDGDPRLIGGVLLAGPYRDVDALLNEQAAIVRTLLIKMGRSEQAADASVHDITHAVEQIADLRAGKLEGDTPILGTPASYWASWLALSERTRQAAPRITKPLLLISGDYDFNVPTTELELWQKALAGKSGLHTLRKLTCITHALNCIHEQNPLAVRPSDIPAHIADSVREQIEAFMHERLSIAN